MEGYAPGSPDDRHREDLALVQRILDGSIEAWHDFVTRYAPLIRAVIRRNLGGDEEMSRTIFANVLEHLYRRALAEYRGSASLATWLAAVTRNRMLDEVRRHRGRRQPPPKFETLSDMEQEVFHLFFSRCLTFDEVRYQLEACGSGLSVEALAKVLDGLESKLGQRLLRRRTYEREAKSCGVASGRVLEYRQYECDQRLQASRDQTPEVILLKKERDLDLRRLLTLVRKLPEEERRILALRFGRGLTAKQVSERLGIGSPRRVYSITERSLRRVRRWMGLS